MRGTDLSELTAWLRTVPHVDDGGESLMGGLVERLRAAGLPLWRCSFSLTTKHPELLWNNVQWTEETGIRSLARARATLNTPFFTRSPVALLVQGTPRVRVPLVPGPLPFPICEDLRDQGATDYLAHALPGCNGDTGFVSLVTRAPGGFDDQAVASLAELVPALAQRIQLESAYHATRALLEVYLGRNAGQRVARGAFSRGTGERVRAAIWFCDLRDFTAMSDQQSPEQVVRTLDAYFDHVAGAVMDQGGEVLKFVGDAILAIFPIDGTTDPASACGRALQAARDALGALGRLNAARQQDGEATLRMGVALHLGEVMYGNIGAHDRLDFTVISAAVNEACRLESLCKPLGTPLTMSEAFVRALPGAGGAAAEAVVDLGEHALKGVRAAVRVFTLSSVP
jgi:adenylate cyclase